MWSVFFFFFSLMPSTSVHRMTVVHFFSPLQISDWSGAGAMHNLFVHGSAVCSPIINCYFLTLCSFILEKKMFCCSVFASIIDHFLFVCKLRLYIVLQLLLKPQWASACLCQEVQNQPIYCNHTRFLLPLLTCSLHPTCNITSTGIFVSLVLFP